MSTFPPDTWPYLLFALLLLGFALYLWLGNLIAERHIRSQKSEMVKMSPHASMAAEMIDPEFRNRRQHGVGD